MRPSAQRWVDLVQGLADEALAVAFLRHELGSMPPEDAAALLAEVALGADARSPGWARLQLLLSVALAGRRLEAMRRAIAQAAEARGQTDLVRRLVGPAGRASEGGSWPVPDFGTGRPLTLGERKAIARRRDRQVLARVLRDPHPDVIRILLENPALTESDVVRLCARRPIAADVLREVFRAPRWIVRYGVRLAIARNPCTPLDLALSIVPHLTAQDARDLAASPELADALREACERALRTRTIH